MMKIASEDILRITIVHTIILPTLRLFERNKSSCPSICPPLQISGLFMLPSVKEVIGRNLDFIFSFHRLRHTNATMLLAAGVPMKAIQHRLGHGNLMTTMNTYAHYPEDLEKATAVQLEKLAIL